MLNIHFGRDNIDMNQIVMNPIVYFSNHRKADWFNDIFVREMIMGIDRAEVIRDKAILKENGRGIIPEART